MYFGPLYNAALISFTYDIDILHTITHSSKLEWEHKGRKIISSTLPQHTRYKRTNLNITHKKRKRKKRQLFEPGANEVLDIPRIMKEENGEIYTCNVYSPSGEMARR